MLGGCKVICDIENIVNHGANVGQGGTEQQQDGTWVAWVVIDNNDLGVYAAGCTERVALKALEVKLRALGNICTAAFAEAESRDKVRAMAESQSITDKLESLLRQVAGPDADIEITVDGLPETKKDKEPGESN